MHIGLVVPNFVATEDDFEYPLYHHLVRGIAQFHDVVVFVLFMEPQHKAGYHWFYNAKVIPLGLAEATSRGLRHIGTTLAHQHQLNIIHAFGIRWAGNMAAAICDSAQLPLLINALSDDFTYAPKALQPALEVATGLIAPSKYALARLSDLVDETSADQFMVHHGIDTDHFTFPDNENRPRDYLAVGELIERRNLDLMLQLVARLPSTTLDIVGDGPLRPDLEKLAHTLGIADRVVFHGYQPYQAMPAFYQQTQTLLVTADTDEAFHVAAIEAMACGTEVMGPAVGILPEVTSTAASHNLADLQELILKRRRKHQDLRRRQLRVQAEYGFGLQKMIEDYLAIYDYIAQHP